MIGYVVYFNLLMLCCVGYKFRSVLVLINQMVAACKSHLYSKAVRLAIPTLTNYSFTPKLLILPFCDKKDLKRAWNSASIKTNMKVIGPRTTEI